jgi:hypothetical protein
MRLIAILILPALVLPALFLPSLAFAAPPSQADQPAVELKLSASNQNELTITIQNHGQQPLELPYRVTPLEHFVIELQGEQGKQYKIEHSGKQTGKQTDQAKPGTLTRLFGTRNDRYSWTLTVPSLTAGIA